MVDQPVKPASPMMQRKAEFVMERVYGELTAIQKMWEMEGEADPAQDGQVLLQGTLCAILNSIAPVDGKLPSLEAIKAPINRMIDNLWPQFIFENDAGQPKGST